MLGGGKMCKNFPMAPHGARNDIKQLILMISLLFMVHGKKHRVYSKNQGGGRHEEGGSEPSEPPKAAEKNYHCQTPQTVASAHMKREKDAASWDMGTRFGLPTHRVNWRITDKPRAAAGSPAWHPNWLTLFRATWTLSRPSGVLGRS